MKLRAEFRHEVDDSSQHEFIICRLLEHEVVAQLLGKKAALQSANFDVAGFQLRAQADDIDLLEPVSRLLGPFEVDALPQTAWRLRIRRDGTGRDADHEPNLKHVWSGEVAPGLCAASYVGRQQRRWDLLNCGRMDVDIARRRASLVLISDAPARRIKYFATLLLCEGWAASGHCLLHAACLAVPIRGEMRSVLIVAKGGTGKSTTALALAAEGWALSGDDIAIVTRQGSRLAAWGFPRPCHVRSPTLQLLPWLCNLPLWPTSIDGTFDLPPDVLNDHSHNPTPTPLEPALIVCLEPPNEVGHRLCSLDRAAALFHLAEENVQPNEGALDATAQRAFATIAELVQQTPACRLSVGPRLIGLAQLLSSHITG